MRPGKSDIYLYLDQKRASNFDGIIGIQPEDGTGKITVTGDVKLNLLNALKQGETIKLRWQRLQTNTQELNLRFAYPFILNTPIGVAAEFDLYRQDTLFSQIRSRLGLQYFFSGGNFVNVFYENAQTNVISNSITNINNYIDSRINMFGIGASITQLDYRFNPRQGYYIEANLAGGEKVIIENPNVEPADYEGINLDSDIYNVNLHAGYYIPFGRRSTLLIRTIGGYFINDNMFKNEMYRIGGLKTLRGFDEQSILASSFIIGTVEYRFILEENSNIFLFFDQGAYQDKSREETIEDTPFGFGGGISFETKPGVFSLTYALGKQFNNPIEIRSGKIHFGFISFF
jgi:hemolysin activation/secretion protein